MRVIPLTLCMIYTDTRILLGRKKRGFGAGKWNGFGGHVEEGEVIEDAFVREVEEEAGIRIRKGEKRGVLYFEFSERSEILEVHLFSAHEFEGEPRETEEMAPRWFLREEIPYAEMWEDDIHWLPLILKGKNVEGRFRFKERSLLPDHLLAEKERGAPRALHCRFAAYDESEPLECPSCRTVMTWSSGRKKFCAACGFVDACCN